jgi:2-(1,2-epoxy-1,2-dihydrophenyl)acetyl-CoA isomerase
MSDFIRYALTDGIATVTLNLPQQLNPLATALQQDLLQALERVERDRAVRVLVLTGAGRAFCVGADLDEMRSQLQGLQSVGAWTGETMRAWTNPLIMRLRSLPVPVLTVVNGPAAGAGVGLALAGDLVVAAASAYFYLPFLPKLGIVPDAGSTWFLPRLVGRTRAMGMSLLGERLSAQRAADWGLIWSAINDDQLAAETARLATQLAALPAHAVREARQAFDAAETNSLDAQLAYECGRQVELIDQPSFREGVAAFFEKRAPVFAGR